MSSIASMNLYQTPKSVMRFIMKEYWLIPPMYYPCFAERAIGCTSTKNFFMRKSSGFMTLQQREYLTIYHGCSRDELQNYEYVSLSFRLPQPEFDLPGVVLVCVPQAERMRVRELQAQVPQWKQGYQNSITGVRKGRGA